MVDDTFLPTQAQEFIDVAFRIFKSGEPATFLVPPNTHKSNIFINQILEKNKTDFHLVVFDLATNEVEDSDDVDFVVRKEIKKEPKKKLVLIINNARNLIINKNFLVINTILDLLKTNDSLQLAFFFNIDITHPEIAKHLRSKIFGNVVHIPLYNKKDTLGFIEYFSRSLKISLEESEKEKVAELCGGYIWLLKQILRCLRDDPSLKIRNSSSCPPVKLALEQLYDSFLDSEKNVLQNLIFGKKIEDSIERHSKEYLEKMGLISDGQIRISMLEEYIRDRSPKMSVELKNSSIYLNSVNVDSHFSQKERRAFKALLDKSNVIISRDELAKAIWPVNTEDFYSDWAVDRIVARLRDKIEELGFAKDVIKTYRNKGYMFEV